MRNDLKEIREETAFEHLDNVCKNACAEQEALLKRILSQNAGTEYGRRYGFDTIRNAEDYRKKVPLSTFEDYDEAIERMIAGEKNVLTAKDPVFYCISSGSLDVPKYLPLTEDDAVVYKLYAVDAIEESIHTACGMGGKVFEATDCYETFMPDGVMNGVRSGVGYRWMRHLNELDISDITSPEEVLFADTVEDLMYVKLRFALAERDVTLINGTFIHRLIGLFRYINGNLEYFIRDIAEGTVNPCFNISAKWENFIKERLKGDPERAKELEDAFYTAKRKGKLIKRIWPGLKCMRVVYGQGFRSYYEEMISFVGDIPIHSYMYASSESLFGVPEAVGRTDYVLLPDVAYFEFRQADPIGGQEDERTLSFSELKECGMYELIITSLSGLYRYKMLDVIRVTGFRGEAPIIQFCYRINQVMDIAGEKMNTEQLGRAMDVFSEECGLPIEGYCVEAIETETPPHYMIYIEPRKSEEMTRIPGVKEAESVLDRTLGEYCFGYRGSRQTAEIGPVTIRVLPAGSFRGYEKRMADTGRRMEQNKPVRVLLAEEQKTYFRRA